ncbi:hypothetical protein BURMUCF2_2631 [Burkholderia multivorans CF2]|nr:hypothetical protein BURMUCF2_2631 [Burkholderia multivorans CF2]
MDGNGASDMQTRHVAARIGDWASDRVCRPPSAAVQCGPSGVLLP